MQTMIYLDNCCFNRPYDDQIQETIRLEIHAKLMIQAAVYSEKLKLAWSFMLDFENEANPYQERRNTIAKWKNLASINIKANEDIRTKANNLHTYGLKPKDALHVAAALAAQCDYFLTTDKQLLKKNEYIKGIQILNPIEFICLQEEPNEI